MEKDVESSPTSLCKKSLVRISPSSQFPCDLFVSYPIVLISNSAVKLSLSTIRFCSVCGKLFDLWTAIFFDEFGFTPFCIPMILIP